MREVERMDVIVSRTELDRMAEIDAFYDKLAEKLSPFSELWLREQRAGHERRKAALLGLPPNAP